MLYSYITVGTRSSTLPVSLTDLKASIAVTGTQDDTRLTNLEWAAVDFIEKQTNRCLVTTTITETWPYFPVFWYGYPQTANTPWLPYGYNGQPFQWGYNQRLTLSRSPISSFTSLKYYDTANVQQTLTVNTDYFFVNPTDKLPFVQPVNYWQPNYPRPDAVQATYQAGYSTLPYSAFQAICLLVGAWNENRQDFDSIPNYAKIPIGVQALIQSLQSGGYW